MSDRMLFIGWGDPVRGAEERAIEVFNEALGILGRKQQEGQIEGFDVALLAPNTDLGGYITIRGDRFVLRDANDTIGGGTVIETQARRHPRRREGVLERLARQESGSPEEPL